MNRMVAILLLAFSASMLAQTPQIHRGSTVYIEPSGGYESYLSAALMKKHVPLTIVTEKYKAEFIIHSVAARMVPEQPSVVINNSNTIKSGDGGNNSDAWNWGARIGAQANRAALGYVTSSITIIDPQSSAVVFAYSNNNSVASRTAESCAKHLKEFIDKSEKGKK